MVAMTGEPVSGGAPGPAARRSWMYPGEPGFTEEPSRLEALERALRVVEADVRATGLDGPVDLILNDGPNPVQHVYAVFRGGGSGSTVGIHPSQASDPRTALVAVADDLQNSVMPPHARPQSVPRPVPRRRTLPPLPPCAALPALRATPCPPGLSTGQPRVVCRGGSTVAPGPAQIDGRPGHHHGCAVPLLSLLLQLLSQPRAVKFTCTNGHLLELRCPCSCMSSAVQASQ